MILSFLDCEIRRKRKLSCEVRETVPLNSRRCDDWISLAKSLQKVLGDSIVHARLVQMVKLGMRLVAFGGGDKGLTKRHHRECKGKECEGGYKTCYVVCNCELLVTLVHIKSLAESKT